MKQADAPRPGWYPDPTGGSWLRWWDGRDWTDHRRSPPTAGLAGATDEHARSPAPTDAGAPPASRVRSAAPRPRDETAEIMAEVRRVARDEVDRAVTTLSDRARDATRGLEPLLSQYGDRVTRWIRNLGIVLIALVVLWMVLQTFAQTSLLNWVGDRVDHIFGGWANLPVRGPVTPTTGA